MFYKRRHISLSSVVHQIKQSSNQSLIAVKGMILLIMTILVPPVMNAAAAGVPTS